MQMDKFLLRHKLPKLTQEKIDNLKSIISIRVIEIEIRNLGQRRLQAHITGEFYQHSGKNNTSSTQNSSKN